VVIHQTELIVPDVPKDLRTPVEVAPRSVDTLGDVGLILTDFVEGLDTANGRIVASDCILSKAEAEVAEQPEPVCSEEPPAPKSTTTTAALAV
jgi:hypothetical protein